MIVVKIGVASLLFGIVDVGTFTVIVIISVSGSLLDKVALIMFGSVVKTSSLTLVIFFSFGSSEKSLVVVSVDLSSKGVVDVVVLLCLSNETYLKYTE